MYCTNRTVLLGVEPTLDKNATFTGLLCYPYGRLFVRPSTGFFFSEMCGDTKLKYWRLRAVKKFSFYLCGNSAIIKVFAYKLPGHHNLQCASCRLKTWKLAIKVTLTSQLIWKVWNLIFLRLIGYVCNQCRTILHWVEFC